MHPDRFCICCGTSATSLHPSTIVHHSCRQCVGAHTITETTDKKELLELEANLINAIQGFSETAMDPLLRMLQQAG